MTTFEDILDIAIDRMRAGETPAQIAADYPDHQAELMALLSISETAFSVPRITPPAPYKRRLYEQKITAKSKVLELLLLSRVAVIPIALLVALVGGRAMVNATESSLPGDTLYSLKRATEEARLTFTRNPEKLATIHVELMQKRVNEVRQAADSGNQAVEEKAIAELQSQTSKTIAEVAPVATANAISRQDSTLLDNLLAVNKEQKDVLTDLTEQENSAGVIAASTALEGTKKNDQTLAKIIATVNDQTMIDLPNKVSITGSISSHYNNRITIEKNTYIIDEKTTVTDINNELVSLDGVTLKGRANIIGVKVDGVLVAKQIFLLPDEDGEVKGETDSAPAPAPAKPLPKPAPKPVEPGTNTNTSAPAPAPAPTETKATGSYISEPSTPQYSN